MRKEWGMYRNFSEILLSVFFFILLMSAPAFCADASAEGPYTADWESLKQHDPAPQWFRDAKFGIYFHWGVYSVPAFGSEWYPRRMYIKGRPEYAHHQKTYGRQTGFSYAGFVPLFKAENFDADAWAELFFKAGARFAGPVAEHHDGFSMWDSDVTPWNAKDKGPGRDITGELAEAIRKRGMKFVTTFHHARNSLWKKNGKWTGHYSNVKTDFPTLLEDPEEAFLYGYMPREQFLKVWYDKLVEVIDRYEPDLMWFDSWLDEIPDATRTAYLAYYFNKARRLGKDVVVTFKQQDLPQDVGVLDLEKGRMNKLTDFCWLTDDTISKGSWCYTNDLTIKTFPQVLHVLIDIVSKNGQLLLNISPKADGTIPEVQREVLLDIGKWLKVNGDAIYGTRPWMLFGEGATRLKRGGGFTHHASGYLKYTAQDIRYTRKGDTLYIIPLGWPDGKLAPHSLQVDKAAPDARISLLGHDGPVPYTVTGKKLVINTASLDPDTLPCRYAYAFKLTGFTLSKSIDAAFAEQSAVTLDAGKAVLEGTQINRETKYEKETIGFWDRPAEKVHWLLKISEPGDYLFRGVFAAISSQKLRLSFENRQLDFSVKATGDWGSFRTAAMGTLTFEKAGVYHCVLEPADPKNWKAVNVQMIQAARVR